MVVHFPIALLVLGFLAEIVSDFYRKDVCLSRIAFYLLVTGTLGAVASLMTGLFLTPPFTGEAGKMKETHELFAIITTGLALITTIMHIYMNTSEKGLTKFRWIVLTLYALTTLSVTVTGFFGGNLVYGT